jgi:hypothetical protein
MTEEEWQACDDPQPMLACIEGKASDRKLRLFAVACCWNAGASSEETLWEELKAAEDVADGYRQVRDGLTHYYEAYTVFHNGGGLLDEACHAAQAPSAWIAASEVIALVHEGWGVILLKEVFGNPFRPLPFSPEWRTGTGIALAHQMYESREFGAMPILADALQDAGCDNEDILSHCRDASATHVRGCWVVDLVLGKE